MGVLLVTLVTRELYSRGFYYKDILSAYYIYVSWVLCFFGLKILIVEMLG